MPMFENTSVFEDTQVFIVRIWREPREIEGALAEPRGMVEIIPSGERKYFQDLDELTNVIRRALEALGWQFKLSVEPAAAPDQNQIPVAENADATNSTDASSNDSTPNPTA